VQPVARIQSIPLQKDLPPGKNGAILTLADGSKVVLDSLGNGVVATQNGSKILLNNGQLAYSTSNNGHPASGAADSPAVITYNTMTTPKGRQFQLLLPDGTKIWLNAASSVRYPTRFTDMERKVQVTGEAYFEVAQNAKAPFVVTVDEQTEIQVLGTHFNINSYADETSINTTLLEGSVRVIHAGEKALLRLGQQAQVPVDKAAQTGGQPSETARDHIKVLSNVNIDKVVAWKNGVFDFQDASLEEVMRQLERWYDIEVVYEKNIPKLEFFGRMGRDLTLSNVLRGLELSKVHFRMEGERRLVILP
jgi:ferric-dicitrate binding protein FerR (iron transport regulator)